MKLRHLPFIQSRLALTVGFGLMLVLMLGATVGGLMRVQAVNRSLDAQQVKADLIASLLNVSRQRTEVVYALAAEGGQARTNWAERRLQRLVLEWGDVMRKLDQTQMTESERTAFRGVTAGVARVEPVLARSIDALRAGDAIPMRNEVLPLQQELQEHLTLLIDAKRTATADAVAKANREARDTLIFMAANGVGVLVFGALIAVVVVRKITRAEAALYREKERAEVTLHSIGDGVVTTDADGGVDYMNPVAEDLTGWRLAGRARRAACRHLSRARRRDAQTLRVPGGRCVGPGPRQTGGRCCSSTGTATNLRSATPARPFAIARVRWQAWSSCSTT